MIFLTSNLRATPFRYDLPINYRDEKSSGRRKGELIPWLAAWHLCTSHSHVREWVLALLLACHHLPSLARATLLLLPSDVLSDTSVWGPAYSAITCAAGHP